MMWILRVLWLVVALDLSEDRYMDDVTEIPAKVFLGFHLL